MSDDDREDSLNAYYRRRQSVKHNQFKGEAEVLHDKDTDAEPRHYNWKSEGAKDTHNDSKSSTIWDDAPWKDKRD